MSKNSQAGLSKAQMTDIELALISFQHGDKTKDDTISKIANILSDRRSVSQARVFDLETVIENVGFVHTEVGLLVNLIKRQHKKRSRQKHLNI